jgi:hypothetical protein
MVGIAATQVPNKRLDVQKLKPTASAGFNFMKEEIFLKKIDTCYLLNRNLKKIIIRAITNSEALVKIITRLFKLMP